MLRRFLRLLLSFIMGRNKFECTPEPNRFQIGRVPLDDMIAGLRDIDGNLYTSVIVGSQEWLVENLRVKHYADGVAIPNITNDALWAAATDGAYCHYDNNAVYESIYGALYNGFVVESPHGLAYLRRDGVVESGWRVPVNADFETLRDEVGTTFTAGGILKDILYWLAPNTGAVNSVGWFGRGGGYRDDTVGAFGGLNEDALFLSDPEDDFPVPVDWQLTFANASFSDGQNPYALGRSVRLVRDIPEEWAPRVIQDYDNNDYDVILINGQEWIVQNLRTTHYSDGENVDNIVDPTLWDGDTNGAFRYYNDDPLNAPIYGALYNWYAGQNAHVLPYFTFGAVQETGWRIPTQAEFEALIAYLGGSEAAHDHLREVGLAHWITEDNEDNGTGFTARGAGFYEAINDGLGGVMDMFSLLTQITYFWSNTEEDVATAYNLTIGFGDAGVGSADKKSLGRSIRCVRDIIVP